MTPAAAALASALLAVFVALVALSRRRARGAPREGFSPPPRLTVLTWNSLEGFGKNKYWGEVGGAVWDERNGVLWVAGSGPSRVRGVVIRGYRVAGDSLTHAASIELDGTRGRDVEGLSLLEDGSSRYLLVLVEGDRGTPNHRMANLVGIPALGASRDPAVFELGWAEKRYAVPSDEAVVVRLVEGRAVPGGAGGASDATTAGYLGPVVTMHHSNGASELTLAREGGPAVVVVVGALGEKGQGFEALAYHGPSGRLVVLNEDGDYAFLPEGTLGLGRPQGPADAQRSGGGAGRGWVRDGRVLSARPDTSHPVLAYHVPDEKVKSLGDCKGWAGHYRAGNWYGGEGARPYPTRCTKFMTWGKGTYDISDAGAFTVGRELVGSQAFMTGEW